MVGKVYKVIFSRRSQRRINQITDYYEEVASKAVAIKIRKAILKTADQLRTLPDSRPVLPDTEQIPYVVRYTKSYAYKLIFIVERKADTVQIIDIVHDAEDSEKVVGRL